MSFGYKKYISRFSLILLIVSSCTLEPKYKKPTSPISQEKIESLDVNKNHFSDGMINDIAWQDFFIDKNLQKIVDLALEKNRDLELATLNIEAARSYYGITRSDLMPDIDLQTSYSRSKSAGFFSKPLSVFSSQLALTSFEIDFFGKFRSLKNSALQDFFATQQAHNSLQISLIAEVVNSYLEFILNHQNMMIAQEIAKINQDQYEIIKMRYENGIDSKSTYLSQKTTLNQAKINLTNYRKIVSQNKNILQNLIGDFDQKIFDSYEEIVEIDQIKIAKDLLKFIPSSKLLDRPDIQQAEFKLKSANANIGAARAAFFPSIMLTSSAGYGSNSLGDIYKLKSVWNFTPQINLPIFSGFANWSNLKLTHVRKKIEIVKYEQAIQNAFKEMSDQLASRKAIDEQLKLMQETLKLQNEVFEISLAKYSLGNESKFNMLNQKIVYLQTKQQYLKTKKDQLTSLINLYKVLGGGLQNYQKQES